MVTPVYTVDVFRQELTYDTMSLLIVQYSDDNERRWLNIIDFLCVILIPV